MLTDHKFVIIYKYLMPFLSCIFNIIYIPVAFLFLSGSAFAMTITLYDHLMLALHLQ